MDFTGLKAAIDALKKRIEELEAAGQAEIDKLTGHATGAAPIAAADPTPPPPSGGGPGEEQH